MADRQGPTGERSSAEIRKEIERTRHQMDETVEQIGDKLSAARILEEVWGRIRAGDGAAMLGEAIRDHPRPFALMGLGIGMLAVEQARAHENGRPRHMGPGTTERAEGRVGPYRADAVNSDDPDWEYAGTGTRVKARIEDAASSLKHAADAVKEKAGDLKESAAGVGGRIKDGAHRVSEAAHDAGHHMSDAAHSAGEKISAAAHSAEEHAANAGHRVAEKAGNVASAARDGARKGATRAKDGFSQLLEGNPMALGAIALGLGIAAGLSVPSTRWEDERVGRRAHALKRDAREMMTETAAKAKRVAHDATEAAREEMNRQRDETGPIQVAMNQLKHSVREVGAAAQDAARKRAEAEELTVDGLKERVRETGRRARATSEVEGA